MSRAWPFGRGRVADARWNCCDAGGPSRAGWSRAGCRGSTGPTMSTPQAKVVGREGQADQRRVAAVGAAHDRHLVAVVMPLFDRPVDGVEQVVVHLAAPLQVAGVDERLAEAGGAAEVDRQHRVAAVGQPLVLAVVAVGVAPPRARRGRTAPAARACPACRRRWRRCPAAGSGRRPASAVARLDLHRVHRLQRRALELGAGDDRAWSASWPCGRRDRRRCAVTGSRRRSTLSSAGARGDADLAVQLVFRKSRSALDRRVERRPLGLQIVDRIGLDLAGLRVGHARRRHRRGRLRRATRVSPVAMSCATRRRCRGRGCRASRASCRRR